MCGASDLTIFQREPKTTAYFKAYCSISDEVFFLFSFLQYYDSLG